MRREEINGKIRAYWPESRVKDFLEGKKVHIASLISFIRENEREYNAACRRFGGFRNVLDSVYPEFYKRLSARIISHEINEDELRKIFLERFFEGLPISYSALHHSKDEEERKLVREVMAISRKNSMMGTERYVITLHELTGLPERDITSVPNKTTKVGFLAEEITEFFFRWARMMNMDLPEYFSMGQIHYGRSEMTRFNLNPRKKSVSF